MKQVLEFLAKEWEIIASAPFSFLIFLAILTAVTQRLWKWYYGKRLADKESTIELLREQLKITKINLDASLLNQAVDEEHYKILEEWVRKKSEQPKNK